MGMAFMKAVGPKAVVGWRRRRERREKRERERRERRERTRQNRNVKNEENYKEGVVVRIEGERRCKKDEREGSLCQEKGGGVHRQVPRCPMAVMCCVRSGQR